MSIVITEEQLKFYAAKAGLEYVGPYKGTHVKTWYKCSKHGLSLKAPKRVREGSAGCRECADDAQRHSAEDIIAKVEACGLVFVSLDEHFGHDRMVTTLCPHGEYRIRVHRLMLNDIIGCRKCSAAIRRKDISEIQEACTNLDLSMCDTYKNFDTKMKFLCKTHGQIEIAPRVLLDGSGCPECRKDRYVREIEDSCTKLDLKLVSEFKNYYKPVIVKCDKHGEMPKNVADILKGSGCKYCAPNAPKTLQALEEDAASVGLEFIGPYVNSTTKTKYRCKTHGIIDRIPVYVYSGQGCPMCRTSSGGFDSGKPGSVYIVTIVSETQNYVGYGITNDMTRRMREHTKNCSVAGFTMKLEYVWHFSIGLDCVTVERMLKDSFNVINTGISGFIREATNYENLDGCVDLVKEYACKVT